MTEDNTPIGQDRLILPFRDQAIPNYRNSRGTGPQTRAAYRRAWALAGFHTRMRAGFPRHAVGRRTIAGDRPPRYGIKTMSRPRTHSATVGRGTIPPVGQDRLILPFGIRRSRTTEARLERRTIAGDRPPHYGMKNSMSLTRGGQAPALRHENGGRTRTKK